LHYGTVLELLDVELVVQIMRQIVQILMETHLLNLIVQEKTDGIVGLVVDVGVIPPAPKERNFRYNYILNGNVYFLIYYVKDVNHYVLKMDNFIVVV
jgi:hypothetical protein